MRIVERKCDCSFQVMPLTTYSETSTLYKPTWEDSGVFTLIYKININGSVTIVDFDIALHVIDGKPQREVYELPKLRDGWYKVKSYIFPTKSFLESLGMVNGYNDVEYQNRWKLDNSDNMFRDNHDMTLAIDETGIYFQGRRSTGASYRPGAYYYWLSADIVDVVDEFLTRGVQNGYVYGTNIRVEEEDFFTTCRLYKCFLNKAQSLLDSYKSCSSGICNNSSNIKCSNNLNSLEIQIRDYMWMTLNAIQFAVECEDFETANRLLNCISTCTGICEDIVIEDCGCGQYKPLTTAKTVVIPAEAYDSTQTGTKNYYNKQEIIRLLNTKQDKLTAGIDINISEDSVISNEHRYFTKNDVRNLWNNA